MAGHRKSPPTVTAETIARHDGKTSVSRCCLEATLDTDWQRSTMYWGAWLYRQLNTMRPSLNATRSGTLSQCSSVCKSRDKPRSNLCVPLTTRAAAFSTRCSLSVLTFGAPANTALQWSTLALFINANRTWLLVGRPHSRRWVLPEQRGIPHSYYRLTAE